MSHSSSIFPQAFLSRFRGFFVCGAGFVWRFGAGRFAFRVGLLSHVSRETLVYVWRRKQEDPEQFGVFGEAALVLVVAFAEFVSSGVRALE